MNSNIVNVFLKLASSASFFFYGIRYYKIVIRNELAAQGACFGYNIFENKCQTMTIGARKNHHFVIIWHRLSTKIFIYAINIRSLRFLLHHFYLFLPETGQKRAILKLCRASFTRNLLPKIRACHLFKKRQLASSYSLFYCNGMLKSPINKKK